MVLRIPDDSMQPASRFGSCPVAGNSIDGFAQPLGEDDEQLFRNRIREGLPTIRELIPSIERLAKASKKRNLE
jgi:hypothetical protein